ncbi:hypothetical protein Q3G72_026824 [Acer saccharum]|nr:hypothetical protein Q3G72_026824 [Acer saccharum]
MLEIHYLSKPKSLSHQQITLHSNDLDSKEERLRKGVIGGCERRRKKEMVGDATEEGWRLQGDEAAEEAKGEMIDDVAVEGEKCSRMMWCGGGLEGKTKIGEEAPFLNRISHERSVEITTFIWTRPDSSLEYERIL